MQPETAETRSDSSPDAPPKVRRRRRSRVRAKPDGRTWVVRRARELAAIYRAKLGDVASDATLAAAITKAAELTAISESMRAGLMRADDSVSADDVVRLQRLADAAVRALDRAAAIKPSNVPSLTEYLAGKHANGDAGASE